MTGVVTLAYVFNRGLNYERALQSCANCGARSRAYYFSLYGIGGECRRVTDEGPIAKLIQEHDGRPCSHRWELYDGYLGSITRRVGASGTGLRRYLSVSMMEAYPDLPDVLEERRNTDPTFVPQLAESVRNGDRRDRIIQDLLSELMARWETSVHSISADQVSDPLGD